MLLKLSIYLNKISTVEFNIQYTIEQNGTPCIKETIFS